MRIALSGSAGTGKTTLAQRLSDHYQVPYLEEGFRKRREAGLNVHALSSDEHKALLLELYGEAILEMETAIQDHGGFVADRSPIDYLAFWLHYGFWSGPDATETLYTRTLSDQASLDQVIVLPWGTLPLAADGIRSTNRWLQLKYQSLLEGLHHRIGTDTPNILWMPDEITILEDRLDHVINTYPVCTKI